jgi:hypothetical protein
MNEKLTRIKDRAGWAEHWAGVASATVQLCDYIAALEARVAALEAQAQQAQESGDQQPVAVCPP